MSATKARAPSLDLDLYSDEVLEDSRPAFAKIRDAGPLVWLPRNRIWAMGRFEDVRAALRDDRTFISGHGVAANPITNRAGRKTTLSSDGKIHDARRKVLMRSLGAKAIGLSAEQISAEAERIVATLSNGEKFDAVADFASGLPVRVVADLVGVRVTSDRMLSWGSATFEALGPLNRRGVLASRKSLEMLLYVLRLSPSGVVPGGWAASVFDAADRGEISKAEAKTMVVDFVAPSLDTTILASAYMLWLLGKNPEAWERIREDPALISPAVVEAVRLASPIRGFTRRLAIDAEIGGVKVDRGSRVAVLFGAANLDERQFPEPERFLLDRDQAGHLGWGNGAHTCVGLHLAKLEMAALLKAMVPSVSAVHVGEPEPIRNNTLQGIGHLQARFEGDSRCSESERPQATHSPSERSN